MTSTTLPRPCRPLALVLLAVLGAGCASTSATEDVTPTASSPAKVDLRDEVGANGLLTPAAILARYSDATGQASLRSYKSATRRGKVSLPAMGLEGDAVLQAAPPDRFVLKIDFEGMGQMNQGYDGEVGWMENPMTGAVVLEGSALDRIVQQAQFLGPLAWHELFPTVETLELTEFNGEPAFKLRLLDANGNENFQYFSQASALLIGTEAVQSGPMGEQPVTLVYSDYQDFGGVKFPTMTLMQSSGMEITQTWTEVTYDDVSGDAFDLPQSIRSLVE